MSKKDYREFVDYLKQCTNAQVLGVIEKERKAARWEYVGLAEAYAAGKGLYVE